MKSIIGIILVLIGASIGFYGEYLGIHLTEGEKFIYLWKYWIGCFFFVSAGLYLWLIKD